MTARAVEIGNITVAEGEPQAEHEYQYERAIILQFDTAEELHEALQAGRVEFQAWPS